MRDASEAAVEGEWLGLADTVRYTGLSKTTIWRLTRRKLLRPARVGRRVLFKRADLDEILERARREAVRV